MKSTNSFSLSGRLVSNATIFEGKSKVARFTVAHNFSGNQPALFLDVVMFSKNGKKEVALPEDLLKKGNAVQISGFLRPNVTEKDGKTYRNIDMVVTSCEAFNEDGD